jgi:RNA polymerase sigma-70 factor, ECF subfamily
MLSAVTVVTGDDERELVRRLREGDESAFEAMLREQGPRMLQAARRFLVEEQDARDAVQNALLSAIKAIGRFEQHSKLSTWLHRIVVNEALMLLRDRRRRPEDSIDELLPRFDQDGKWQDGRSSFEDFTQLRIEGRETREFVRKCIAKLPESYRIVLLMRDIQDLDTSEVAATLDIAPGSVKVRRHRARQALRKILMQESRVTEGLA